MTTDFRALCAELAAWLHAYALRDPLDIGSKDEAEHDLAWSLNELLARACAALAATEQKVSPQCVADGCLEEAARQEPGSPLQELLAEARAALARWGRPAVEPVPVSERLPGPEDCAPWPDEPDAAPWAWAAKCVAGGWEWAQLSMLGMGSDSLARSVAGGGWTHWAPHWALPVPQEGSDG